MSNVASRRKVLSAIGAGSAALAGLPALTAASEEQRETAANADASKRLLAELNNPEIVRASRKEVKAGEDLTVTSTILNTEIGDLIYADVGGEHKGIQFHLKPRGRRESRSHPIPSRYEGVPEDWKGILLVDAANTVDEIGYLRDVSEEAASRLRSLVGVDANRIMFNSSVGDNGGYEVHVSAEEKVGPHSEDRQTVDGDREAYLVPIGRSGRITGGDIEHVADPDSVRTQGECRTWINACLTSITICSGCLMTCASVGVGAIPMALACITCNMGCHGAIPTMCGKAVNNC